VDDPKLGIYTILTSIVIGATATVGDFTAAVNLPL